MISLPSRGHCVYIRKLPLTALYYVISASVPLALLDTGNGEQAVTES